MICKLGFNESTFTFCGIPNTHLSINSLKVVNMENDVVVEAVLDEIEAKFILNFRPFHRIVDQKVLNEEDVLVCAPTGSGNTNCFTFLLHAIDLKNCSLHEHEEGGSIVLMVSPLSRLMVEQTTHLIESLIESK